MDFKFDERAIRQVVEGAVTDLSRQYDRLFDRLRRQYQGRPIGEVKAAIQREWPTVNGGSISDPELSEFAEAVAAGTAIKFKPTIR